MRKLTFRVCNLICAAAWMILILPTAALSQDWPSAIEHAQNSIVTIRVDATRAFDGEWNASTQATGFVVDAERGIILTNRHVVTQGPVIAEAIFLNGEEVELTPVYRDPVHDFGFFRFDPTQLQFFEPVALTLSPASAQVGTEIRVIGNDAGEQLAILAATLAKLDRQAPEYGRQTYNDFNTFYIQASSNTSGGSSGSPVIDIHGEAVALNAGGRTDAAASFFLPLDRILPALETIRNAQPVPRGTWQTTFSFRRFDELRRLGLSLEQEKQARETVTDIQGMLVVSRIIPLSQAYQRLKVGDILFKVNDQLVTHFTELAAMLDEKVGQSLNVTVIRGGQVIETELTSDSLHDITPNRTVSVGGASLHDLSYQQARNLNRPLQGVFVASPGAMLSAGGMRKNDIILEMDGQPVNRLDDVLAQMGQWPHGKEISVRFIRPNNPREVSLSVVRVDRQWHSDEICQRQPLMDWSCEKLPAAPPAEEPTPQTVSLPATGQKPLQGIASSLVRIQFEMPFGLTGISRTRHGGQGLIIDHKKGLIVTDRNTVPVTMGQAHIIIGGALSIPAKVISVHPVHNLALLAYDPALLGDTPLQSVKFAKKQVEAGDPIWLASVDSSFNLLSHETQIKRRDALYSPLSASLAFRQVNLDAVDVINTADVRRGVLINRKAEVVALWTHEPVSAARGSQLLNYGIPSELLQIAIGEMQDPASNYAISAEFTAIPPLSARELGVPEPWLKRYQVNGKQIGRLMAVERIMNNGNASLPLKSGDILLSINDQHPSDFLELLSAANEPQLDLLIWRNGEELSFQHDNSTMNSDELSKLVSWGGAVFHPPHAAARMLGVAPEGAYIAFYSFGSPASRYGLSALQSVVEVNEVPIRSIDDFAREVAAIKDREPARFRLRTWDGREQLITLKADLRYWPGAIWERKDGEWAPTAM